MSRRRLLTPQQLAEIREAAKRGPDGKPLEELVRGTIEGTATAPEPASQPPPRHPKGRRRRDCVGASPTSSRRGAVRLVLEKGKTIPQVARDLDVSAATSCNAVKLLTVGERTTGRGEG